jgi:anionic cell wall polymer biosynthesis LytR-Cps2A-Psr (LCP) family protein
VKRLDGLETLWFARARHGSDDYSRMARQKCVMGAMLEQVSPQVALRNFQAIAEASSAMVSTNLPGREVGRFIELAMKARSQKIGTVSLVPPLVNTADPQIPQIRELIQDAIDRSEGDLATTSERKKKRQPQAVTGGSLGSLATGYAANQAGDLGAAC